MIIQCLFPGIEDCRHRRGPSAWLPQYNDSETITPPFIEKAYINPLEGVLSDLDFLATGQS